MPDDPSSVRGTRAPELDLWLPAQRLWDIYFAVVALGTVVMVAGQNAVSGEAKVGALALLVGLITWYVAWGRRLMLDEVEDWRGYVYALGVLAMFVPAVALADSAAIALFGLCPQAYILLRSAAATVAVTVLTIAQAMVFLATTGDVAATVADRLPNAVVVIVVSAVLGSGARAFSRKNDELAALIVELDSSRAEVARLSHEAGVTAERQRLAGEIHDTVAQGLALIVVLLQAADAQLERDPAEVRRRLHLAADTARENLKETRVLIAALTPNALTGTSLAEAIARLVDRFTAETGVTARWSPSGTPRGVPTAVDVVLLRAAQEALANVRKHAKASAVTVSLCYGPDSVVLAVSDDGRGFAPSVLKNGYGLTGMRTRVEQVSGSLRVDSRPGAGTTIVAEVPI